MVRKNDHKSLKIHKIILSSKHDKQGPNFKNLNPKYCQLATMAI